MNQSPPSSAQPPIVPSRQFEPPRRHPLPPPVRIVLGLALLVLIGTLLLMLPISGTRQLSWNEAFFTATSALTVTGLSTITAGADLTLFGIIVLLTLIQIGGVGFMVVAVIILRLLGRRISLADRIALSDSLGLLSPQAIVRLTGQVLVTVLLIEAIAALILFLHWRTDPRLSDEQALLFAIFHAVSAFCNAGFDLFSGRPDFPESIPHDPLSLLVIGTLVFLGTLGIPVLGDFVTYRRTRRLSLHTRITLTTILFLLLIGAVGLWLSEARNDGALVNEPLGRQLANSLFQSISARSGGFDGISNYGDISEAGQLLLIALMFIGGAPASMGGGITTGTFAALAISLWSYARGESKINVAGRTLAVGTIRKAAAVLTISLFVVLLGVWLILMTHDAPISIVTFEVVSAFATCGLTMGLTTELNLFGQILICLMMFWGRAGALTVVILIARQQSRLELVQYPEEQILIG
ncbi:MAG: TrkH family potassium uptake protein [Oscillochloridaceae bacterium umkhey_bin13]